MSSIESLGISGIRGYSFQNYQKILFRKPLTLIWGKNGSGKTTIIECLKYITTGSLPPSSDKGKTFIMDPKVAGTPEVIGDIRIIFKTGERAILAKRRMQLSAKGNTTKFESIEQVLKTKGQNGEELTINHQCAEIQKQVPQFLGISKPILENIVFCHQDESLWPFGDNALLKNIFDELFQTNKITKEMERVWDCHKEQSAQLKQLKVRVEYQRETHLRQLDQRSKLYLELDELEMRSRNLEKAKREIMELKKQLIDNKEKLEQRNELYKKEARLESAVASIEGKIQGQREALWRVLKEYKQRMKGKSQTQLSNSINSILVNNNPKPSQTQLQQLQFLIITNFDQANNQLQQRRTTYKHLITKQQTLKDNLQTLKSFQEISKREQQIRSEVDRIKGLVVEFRVGVGNERRKGGSYDEEFLKMVREKVGEMERKRQRLQMCKRELDRLEIPNEISMGMNEKQVQQLKRQSKRLQQQIQLSSITLLKVYKSQYTPTPATLPPSEPNLAHGQSIQSQLQQLTGILKSKQQQLSHYQTKLQQLERQQNSSAVPQSTKSLMQEISHYRYAGIQLQEEMLHYCEQKRKCYFCSKAMSQDELEMVTKKVEGVKVKTKERIRRLEEGLAGREHEVDAKVMVKKLREEVRNLIERQRIMNVQVGKFNEAKKHQEQRKLNELLKRQLSKCNLTIQILNKLSYLSQKDPNPQQYYRSLPLQKFIQLSTQFQVKMSAYKGIKEEYERFQRNQQNNLLIRKRREEAIKKKQELVQEVAELEEDVRNYEFLKSGERKLEALMRVEVKSKKGNKVGGGDGRGETVEETEWGLVEVGKKMAEQKFAIQRLELSMNHTSDCMQLKEQLSRLQTVKKQISQLSVTLNASQQVSARYSQLYFAFGQQASLINSRTAAIQQALKQPLENSYIKTLTRIRHLQSSLLNIELLYRRMQQSVALYHADKMQQINRYIYEVWRDIYHGRDIEYIEIEATTEKDTKRKKKNYVYRIMMRKSTKDFGGQDVEMVEMKGRCSTGQKVLASIVIRLALAEVFCSSTRILALDQPTTNLDEEHIENLAKALLRLIELSGGKNLQLIIISHDIEFIKLLEEWAQTYYEVSRDKNKFSVIEERLIKEIYTGAQRLDGEKAFEREDKSLVSRKSQNLKSLNKTEETMMKKRQANGRKADQHQSDGEIKMQQRKANKTMIINGRRVS